MCKPIGQWVKYACDMSYTSFLSHPAVLSWADFTHVPTGSQIFLPVCHETNSIEQSPS